MEGREVAAFKFYLNDEQFGAKREAYFFFLFYTANFLRGGNACDIKGWKGLMAGHQASCVDIEILSTMRRERFFFSSNG